MGPAGMKSVAVVVFALAGFALLGLLANLPEIGKHGGPSLWTYVVLPPVIFAWFTAGRLLLLKSKGLRRRGV
jgi:hypothetical protein